MVNFLCQGTCAYRGIRRFHEINFSILITNPFLFRLIIVFLN